MSKCALAVLLRVLTHLKVPRGVQQPEPNNVDGRIRTNVSEKQLPRPVLKGTGKCYPMCSSDILWDHTLVFAGFFLDAQLAILVVLYCIRFPQFVNSRGTYNRQQ